MNRPREDTIELDSSKLGWMVKLKYLVFKIKIFCASCFFLFEFLKELCFSPTNPFQEVDPVPRLLCIISGLLYQALSCLELA